MSIIRNDIRSSIGGLKLCLKMWTIVLGFEPAPLWYLKVKWLQVSKLLKSNLMEYLILEIFKSPFCKRNQLNHRWKGIYNSIIYRKVPQYLGPILNQCVKPLFLNFSNVSKLRVGLNRTGHMSFLTGHDQTPKFAGQVLPDRTESGLIFLTFYLTSMGYQFSYDKVPGYKFSIKNLNWDVFENKEKKDQNFVSNDLIIWELITNTC